MSVKVQFRYLSQEDIIRMKVPYRNIIAAVEGALESLGKDMIECPPKPGIHTRHSTFLHAMPAFLIDKDLCGMKWVSGYPENYKKGLPQIAGIIVYNCPETGMPLAIMDCRWITAFRTAATSAVCAKYCKPVKCETLSLIGAGVQGRTHALLLKEVAPEIKRIVVTDVRAESIDRFKQDMQPLLNVEIVTAASPEEAARQADILVTGTQRLEKPIVKLEWLRKGALGIALEASRAWEGKAFLQADKYVTDDWELTKSYHAQGAFPDGLPERHTILGKIVAGFEKGRENADDFIMSVCEGMATTDIAVAKEVYTIAEQKNIGVVLPLMEQESIF